MMPQVGKEAAGISVTILASEDLEGVKPTLSFSASKTV
jgi:hypothetical protein